jgi:hypothetical protein
MTSDGQRKNRFKVLCPERIMWIMLLLLWAVPLGIAALAVARALNGTQLLQPNERKLLFDETKSTGLSPGMAAKFAGACVVFFIVGLLQGVLLTSMSALVFVVIPLLTGGAAVAVVILWIRTAPRAKRIRRLTYSQRWTGRLADIFFK